MQSQFFMKNKNLSNSSEVVFSIGKEFDEDEIKKEIPNFYELYKKSPFKQNLGGMGASHMFACYFLLKKLNPSIVIELGVWKGGSTWLIENTLPNAKIISLDPNLKKQRYISKNAKYIKKDFGLLNWDKIPKEKTLIIFDDHQNALKRVKQAKKFGFKHLIFDDNNPPSYRIGNALGDFYSIKKILAESGHFPNMNFKTKISKTLWALKYTRSLTMLKQTVKDFKDIPANKKDREYLLNLLDIYYEFPPLFSKDYKLKSIEKWFRKKPLLSHSKKIDFPEFYKSRQTYNGLCYLKLK